MSPYHCEYIWTLREPSTQVLSVYLRLSAKTKSLPLKTNFILVNQHFETISVLPTRRIFKNRGPSRRYQVAQNHKAQEKLGSSSTKAQRHAGHRRDTASQDAQKPLSPAHQELYSRSQKLKTWKLISKNASTALLTKSEAYVANKAPFQGSTQQS